MALAGTLRNLPACASGHPGPLLRGSLFYTLHVFSFNIPNAKRQGTCSNAAAARDASTAAAACERRITHQEASTSQSSSRSFARAVPHLGRSAIRTFAALSDAPSATGGQQRPAVGDDGSTDNLKSDQLQRQTAVFGDEEEDDWDAPPAGRTDVRRVVQLPQPTNVKVKTAEFVKSSVQLDQCPKQSYPEFAVIGRSNVGKSSLINMITGRKALAMVSKTPGKTKCINHFIINKSWYLVDLPGYGYAKRSKDMRLEWNTFTRQYFLERDSLACVLLLVDASVPPQDIDVKCAAWLGDSQVPFTIVFTKVDKRKKKAPPPSQNIADFEAALLQEWESLPPVLVTSSATGHGKPELLQHIAQIRTVFNHSHHGL